MNNPTTDFEEWLDSIGFNTSSPETHTQAEQAAVINEDLPSESEVIELIEDSSPAPEVQPVSFSEEDMDSLLAENGFAEPQYNEAEALHNSSNDEDIGEEENTPEDELTEFNPESVANTTFAINIAERRNLDTEEDADWEGLIDSGGIVPVASETTTPSESSEGSTNLLPENSPTISIDESTSRFSGTEWYEEVKNKSIMIAGCGGIGSWLSLLIARLTPYKMTLYDDDMVELANLSGQFFERADVGKHKVRAVYDKISAYTNMYNVMALSSRFTETTPATDIMLCGFDSMEARKTYYYAWKNHLANVFPDRRKNCFFMDGRLTIDTLQVICFTGEDTYNMERYEREFLFDDSQADSEVCSMKQTTYLACMIGSIMTNLFINWIANSLDPIIPYKLPFFTQYEAQHMIFKTEE